MPANIRPLQFDHDKISGPVVGEQIDAPSRIIPVTELLRDRGRVYAPRLCPDRIVCTALGLDAPALRERTDGFPQDWDGPAQALRQASRLVRRQLV